MSLRERTRPGAGDVHGCAAQMRLFTRAPISHKTRFNILAAGQLGSPLSPVAGPRSEFAEGDRPGSLFCAQHFALACRGDECVF
jgi:hypothetical protein